MLKSDKIIDDEEHRAFNLNQSDKTVQCDKVL